ncbi:RagB/SusD family nutrient uptake outer membrane protein [Myroides marinus]|uniref:RagB/SusD family nutrient uptake outer membrane protein n=1 Tax=Myroides marinus TaxID=703342 RepID=UPI0025774A89|nr:RagB/SusD family nutrient uptake outer membrane protein [Myroides marinus]MDM1367850.1 RagB/SusD family nutrient uptake outer membrane protein [Myroides marinus]MDM1373690.1 RagB/SusD family nutrient uptake outer membrane protein [Myroides marinus]MDM1376228.1 RagB/SusD family nutrient uptake outer membrane protein [Myroides marinus]MDM1382272.1 RagB/SusD family nutrient uptake outer membrane protein [Myroides marinus]MDM1391628.1 RagB/SusD family nutrient uptake outer membrane protein [Myr
MKKIIYSSLLLGAILITSCSEDYTVTDQGNHISDVQIRAMLAKPESATVIVNALERGEEKSRAMSGIAQFGSHEDFGQKAVDIYMDAMSNDMVFPRSDWFAYAYTYQDRLENGNTATIYNYFTKSIALADYAIQMLMGGDKDYKSNPVYARLLAVRGYSYLYLTQLYSYNGMSVPYSYVDDNGIEHKAESRTSQKELEEKIEKELLTAYAIFEKSGYVRADKSYIDKNVVSGILSRYYLYKKDGVNAQKYALEAMGGVAAVADFSVVNTGNFSELNNADWMWGYPIDNLNSGYFASYFSHMDTFGNGYGRAVATPKSVDRRLYEGMNTTDKRKTEWFADGVKDYTGGKWEGKKVLSKYINTKFIDKSNFNGDYLYMRRTEMYFNYMEALALTDKDSDVAKNLLVDYMKTRDSKYSFADRNQSGVDFGFSRVTVLDEIRFQRRIEFWGEGFGLLDMKRWGLELKRKYGEIVKDSEGNVIKNTLSNHTYQSGLFDLPVGSNSFILQFPRNEINVYKGKLEQNPVD